MCARRLENKVAIITGGSTGIGKSLALGFAKEGAGVVITARGEERLMRAAEEIKSVGGEVLALVADVSVMSDIDQMVRKTLERFGKIDILVNNAGIIPFALFLEKDEKTFDEVVKINFKGSYFCTQFVAKFMVKRNYGKIINISSSHGRGGYPGMSEYAGTKGAIIALTRSLAAELSPFGINVNGIACGFTGTEGVNALNLPKEFFDEAVKIIPLRRMGKPEDYVGISVFLASDESSYMTGQTISVDGGLTMP